MKKHIKSHSYKRANYKCDDCDFVGESEFTMEVHIGKFHSEKYECGLCDFEATNFENLEIHLVTCEIYQCDHCKMKFKSIRDIKEHIVEKQYSGGYEYVHHLKFDRNNQNEVSDKMYDSEKI